MASRRQDANAARSRTIVAVGQVEDRQRWTVYGRPLTVILRGVRDAGIPLRGMTADRVA